MLQFQCDWFSSGPGLLVSFVVSSPIKGYNGKNKMLKADLQKISPVSTLAFTKNKRQSATRSFTFLTILAVPTLQ